MAGKSQLATATAAPQLIGSWWNFSFDRPRQPPCGHGFQLHSCLEFPGAYPLLCRRASVGVQGTLRARYGRLLSGIGISPNVKEGAAAIPTTSHTSSTWHPLLALPALS